MPTDPTADSAESPTAFCAITFALTVAGDVTP